MIDDKQIEEAAYRFATSQEHGELLALIDGYKEGYKDAINEFLKELWHPNTEEPDKSKSDIITIGSYNYVSLHFKESFIWKEESWRHSISRYQIIKWAYLSDILPKKGGEE